ncbi:MAG: thiolase family protein [Candidatus Omnitrophota bacterium]
MSQRPAYIVSCARTPIGKPFKGLKEFTAARLGAMVLKEVVRRSKIPEAKIDEVVLGNTVSAGTGQNLSRQAVLLADLPASLPAYTVNNVCGAGLQSVILAGQSIQAGNGSVILAGGAESATHCPSFETEKRQTKESLIYDGLICQLTGKHMGELAEDMAREFWVTREAQDKFSLRSHQKACQAQAEGKFQNEIVPVPLARGGFFSEDERPRKNISLESLSSLPPAFCPGGMLTAGNSCAPSDGASAFAVAAEDFCKKERLAPLARIVGSASIALPPKDLFVAGVDSIKESLAKSRLSLKEIDLFEISEAFAVQVLYTKDKMNIPEEKINIWGGDIALGHPLGAAGSRILVTLIYSLIDQKKSRGLACVCFGGGGSISLIVEIVR